MRSLKSTLGCTFTNRGRNNNACSPNVVVKENVQKWCDHLAQIAHDREPVEALKYTPIGKKNVRRSRKQ